jgi:two-component system cell cycle sensor histidine kinase/response regulator CckA
VSVDHDRIDLAQAKGVQRGNLALAIFLAVLLALTAGAFAYSAREFSVFWVLVLLGVFAALGLITLFGIVAGFVQVGWRRREDAFFEAMFDAVPDACAVTDGRGRVILANEAYRDFAGDPQARRLQNVDSLYAGYPAIADNIYRLSQAMRDSKPAQEELRLMADSSAPGARAGATAWIRITVAPIEPHGGRASALWRVHDVTDERVEQERAFQQLQHIIDYLDHSPAGFFSSDADGQIQYINATLADWLGLDLTETTGGALKLSDIVQEDGARVMGSIEPVPGGAQVETFDIDFLSSEGKVVPARVLHRVSFDAQGRQRASRSLVLDRSPGSDVAETVRTDEVRLARFFKNAPIGIAILATDGTIRNANGAFARAIGHASARGKRVIDLINETARNDVQKALDAAWEGHVGVPPVEVNFTEDGSRSGQLYVSRVEDEGEDGPGLIVYATDTTTHRALELQFTQSQKMNAVGQLAGGVAHDFNNVLTVIIGNSDLLLARLRPTDPSFRDIMDIKQNANRAANLVRQLLAFSRRQTLRPEVMSMTDVLADLGNLLGKLLGEKIELKIVHGRELWKVKVDLNQFEQVVINLAVNARDAMPDGGLLSVRTANIAAQEARAAQPNVMPEGEYVLCEIGDNGTGMSKELLDKIYEPFFTTKEVGKGTGLGLSTVYGIIKQTGGYIFADSEVGKGTRFSIYLPRHVEEPGVEQPEKKADEKADAKPVDLTGSGTILLVEDEEAVRAFASRALNSRGYTVLTADSGESALKVIEEHDGDLDLVISDVVMPEMDGPTLLKELRKRDINTKIIFISGYAEDAFKKNLEEDQVFAFLPKPFSLKQLAETVKGVLDE